MNGTRVLAVVLLVGSLFVIGTMSASLHATVNSTPDDVVNVDTNELPFLGHGASEIADSYKRAEGADQQADLPTSADTGETRQQDSEGPMGNEQPSNPQNGQPDAQQHAADRTGDSSNTGGSQGSTGGSGQGENGQGGTGDPSTVPWSLLARLLVLLLSLLALLLVAAAVALAVRHRDRIIASLRELAERYGLLGESNGPRAGADTAGEQPGSVVERAWGEMLAAAGVSPPQSDTPRECARAAVDAGADREPVENLTTLYEQVRYGDRPVTPDQTQHALVWLRAVGDERPGPSDDGGLERGRGSTGGTTTIGDGGTATVSMEESE